VKTTFSFTFKNAEVEGLAPCHPISPIQWKIDDASFQPDWVKSALRSHNSPTSQLLWVPGAVLQVWAPLDSFCSFRIFSFLLLHMSGAAWAKYPAAFYVLKGKKYTRRNK
jgi:hypothetical protein